MYFNNCNTLDEAKTLFRKLCKELHPDKGGKASDFIKMQAEFKAFKPKVKNDSDANFDADKFYNLVQKFEGLNNIKVSFVGIFIWLEDMEQGATYEQKEVIKAIKLEGFNTARFARKKKAWYFSPIDYKQKFRSKKTLDQVKQTWGCQSFKTKEYKKLT